MLSVECSIQNLKLTKDGKIWRCKFEEISEPGVWIACGVAMKGGGSPRESPLWDDIIFL